MAGDSPPPPAPRQRTLHNLLPCGAGGDSPIGGELVSTQNLLAQRAAALRTGPAPFPGRLVGLQLTRGQYEGERSRYVSASDRRAGLRRQVESGKNGGRKGREFREVRPEKPSNMY